MMIIRGSHLRAMRLFADKTTMEMAAAAGVKTRKTYENWESNTGGPNVNQFISLLKFCDLDYLKVFGYIMRNNETKQFDLLRLLALSKPAL